MISLRNKSEKLKYDLRLLECETKEEIYKYGGLYVYNVAFETDIPVSWMAQAAAYLTNKTRLQTSETLSSFDVDERLHPKFIKKFKTALDQVEADVKQDRKFDTPNFKMLTYHVECFKYIRAGDHYNVKINIVGCYSK